MNLLIMQHSVDFDLDEIESRLYSQVFHSTENWDQTPNHPILNKVPERQVTTYSINNQTVNSSRYWDGKTQAKTSSNEIVTQKSTENTSKSNEMNDNNKTLQNNNDKNISRKVGLVEEYIGLDSSSATNIFTNRNDFNIDFSKDDLYHHPQNFFCNPQDNLIQQSEIQKQTPNNFNNNTDTNINNQCDEVNPFAHLIDNIKALVQENTLASKKKARRLRYKLKLKQVKHEKRTKRLIKDQAKKEKRLRKLGILPNNNVQSFSFVNQFNNIQRKTNQNNSNFNKSVNLNTQSPIIKQTEINESTKNQQEEIINNLDDNLVILSDSDSDSDEVIEIPLPEKEIVCIDSSSENSDTDDTICVDDNIVKNMPSTPKQSNSITEENVSKSPKLETSEIKNNTPELKSEGDTKNEQILNNKEDKIEEIEVMKNIEETATTLSENEEKIDETKSSSNQINTSINEIEKERAELLCTPDSNTNDFMANDVCDLNKSNFCFNFNLHDPDLGLSRKEISKPSISDVYETESSCSEAGPPSKNQSYFNEVDFESPVKEIFAEPDLAKFSSFITPIRNRNISNVANSTSDLTPVKTKAGVVDSSSFNVNLFNKNREKDSCNSDEYNSDPTTLPVKKKIKKKKKKAKKKDTNEPENKNKTDNNQEQTETSNNTEIVNKPKKKQRNKAITYENLKLECALLNQKQSNSAQEKLSKAKEKKLRKKNKRKSDQLENEVNTDSSNKKPKNLTKLCDVQKNDTQTNKQVTKIPEFNGKPSTSTNKDNNESLPKSASKSKPIEDLNSTAEYYDKVDSHFADDILYTELENRNKPETTENQIINDKDDDNDTLSNNEKCSYTNETINISSDSDTEIVPQSNDENTSSSSNIVLNIFSPEISNNESENIVANPFSFVQNFDTLNHKRGFKDIWTNDMNEFYNESWGHENYDLTTVQQSMPSDFSKWSVNTADQFPVKGKKRGPMCLRCREFGHLQFRCPKLHEAVKCTTCGDEEHTSTRCPKSICTTCRGSTQHHTTSCNNCSHYKTIRCPICNYIGHLPRDCPDLWRRYHLTTSDNNSVVASTQMMKPPNMLWCSNCANCGHSANNCNYLRTDHFPTYPGIQNYTPVYNNIPSLLELPQEQQIPVHLFENVNLSQIHNYRTELVENNNKKYLNMIKSLRRHIGKNEIDLNLNDRLNYLQNAATNNQFNKRKIGELYKISKILRNSR